jgi:hypothetical protein
MRNKLLNICDLTEFVYVLHEELIKKEAYQIQIDC